MRPRDYLLSAGAFAMLAIAAIAWLGDPTVAGELPPPGDDIPFVIADEARSHGDAPGAAIADGGPVHPSEVATADPVFRRGRDTTGWTSGVIKGDIPLTPTVVHQIESISVVVDELKNIRASDTPPFRKVVPVILGQGTPTFEVRDVPFSDYGYVVRVHSPGLNGGQSTVSITREQPYVDDVKLPITPGTPFSILLRDQHRTPVFATEVRLVPFSDPHGRPTFFGTSDNYGSVVFENVLAGPYRAHIGSQAQPLMEPVEIQVQPGSYTQKGSTILPQGTTISVPRGQPMQAKVMQAGSWALPGALVKVRATDRRQHFELEGETDVRGLVSFANLLPGQWEIEVSMPDFERRLRQFQVKADEAVPDQTFEMVRIR